MLLDAVCSYLCRITINVLFRLFAIDKSSCWIIQSGPRSREAPPSNKKKKMTKTTGNFLAAFLFSKYVRPDAAWWRDDGFWRPKKSKSIKKAEVFFFREGVGASWWASWLRCTHHLCNSLSPAALIFGRQPHVVLFVFKQSTKKAKLLMWVSGKAAGRQILLKVKGQLCIKSAKLMLNLQF